MIQHLQRFLVTVSSLSISPDDDEVIRLQKSILLVTTLVVTVATVLWGLMYLSADESSAALIPFAYSAVSILGLIVLSRTLRFDLFRFVQILMGLLLPFLLMLVLGGYVHGSAVILWGFLAPLGALLSWNRRQAVLWFFLYLASLALAGVLTPLIPADNNLSNALIIALFVFNIGGVASIAFVVFLYFLGQRELAIELLQKNRDLERTNLERELMLRQSEKLATLGRLSAGVAHELNNPAAAVQRGAAQLGDAVSRLGEAQLRLGGMRFPPEQRQTLTRLSEQAQERNEQTLALDPLARSDRESEIEDYLEDAGLENAWDHAPILVGIGYGLDDVTALADTFTTAQFSTVIASLGATHTTHTLLDEIGQGASRISEIVAALKSYTYMDQAPVQLLDIHEGLDNTLVMLGSKLRNGIDVRREYAEGLPDVQGYGGELNQVWTNLIDNAIDAMDGRGQLWLRTHDADGEVIVEITDSGPGIPEENVPHIFDPFYTTKPVGKGTGLGLSISHNIVVQKHRGEISVHSRPGETRFRVKLPVKIEEGQEVED